MIIREEEYVIDYYCPFGLKKHVYSMDSVFKRARPKTGGTGILFDNIVQKERKNKKGTGILSDDAEGLLNDLPRYYEEDAITDDPNFVPPEPAPSDLSVTDEPADSDEEKAKPKRQFRALQKVEKLIFDETPELIGELEDEAFALLNADGYYDEILPVDYDEDFQMDAGPDMRIVAILILSLVVLGIIAFKMIASWF